MLCDAVEHQELETILTIDSRLFIPSGAWNLLILHPQWDKLKRDDVIGHKQIKLIEDLFEKKWLVPEMITGEMIMKFLGRHTGFTHDDMILTTLVKYLPKDFWKTIESEDGHDIISGIFHAPKTKEQETRWVKTFIGLGCDPMKKTKDGNTIFPYCVTRLNHELVTLLLDEYRADVNEMRAGDPDDMYYYAESPLISLLREHAQDKTEEELEPVKKMIKILNDHKVDWNYVIPEIKTEKSNYRKSITGTRGRMGMGCCAHDFVYQYGWKEYLGDLVPEKKDYKSVLIREFDNTIHPLGVRFDIMREHTHAEFPSQYDKDFAKLNGPALKTLQALLDELFVFRFIKDKKKIDQMTAKILTTFGKLGEKFIRGVENKLIRYGNGRWLEGFYTVGPVYEYFQMLANPGERNFMGKILQP